MSKYDEQANAFAKKYGVRLTSRYIDFECNENWDEKHPSHHWKCKLIRGHSSYTFDFWMGRALTGNPTMYDVLSALTSYDPGDFTEFCREFGYDAEPLSEYPRVKKVYDGCCKEYKAMKRLFPDCMEELQEIQ